MFLDANIVKGLFYLKTLDFSRTGLFTFGEPNLGRRHMLKGRKLFVGCGDDIRQDGFDLFIRFATDRLCVTVGNNDSGNDDFIAVLFLSAKDNRLKD